MTDPKNPESTNEELGLDQLEEAAGGAAFMKLGDIKGEAIWGEATFKAQKNWSRTKSQGAANYFQPREVTSVEIGEPPEPKLWHHMLG